jgi:glycosyltransferase involved in cell wall biosynthesis
MKVSIITINFNNVVGLKETIESVVSQTYPDIEYIVIDGGSTDGSSELIKNNIAISYSVSEKDNGIYHAQNKGIKVASGNYCLFLNSGDTLVEKHTIENAVKSGLNKDIVYGDLILKDQDGNTSKGISPDILNVHHFMVSTLWHPCTFIKRSLFEKYGYYKENFKITGDYEFFIRTLVKNKVSYKHIHVPVSVFDLKGVSNDPANERLQNEERKKSWLANFSPLRLKLFELSTRLIRRKEHMFRK